MHPVARREGFVVRPLGTDVVVLGPDRAVHRLDAVAGWVFQHADGSRNVASLLIGLRADVDANADTDIVFEALDRLADAGLLAARVAPPSGVSRRGMLQRLSGAAAIAALSAVVSRPAFAAAGGVCAEDKEIIDAIAELEALESDVSEILDDWADDAENEDKVDEFYVARLRTKEREHKKMHLAYAAKLDLATDDLADCKLEASASKLSMEKRTKQAQAQSKVRQEHLAKRGDASLQRAEKRLSKQRVSEEGAKQKLTQKEEKQKDQLRKKIKDEAQQESAIKASSKEYFVLSEMHEKRDKTREVKLLAREAEMKTTIKEQIKAVEVRYEEKAKNIDAQLLHSEERAKIFADSYTERKSEYASKDAGVTDRALELAQEEAMKAAELAAIDRKQDELAKEKEAKSADLAQEKKMKTENVASEAKIKQ